MARDVSGKGSWKEEFLALTFIVVFLIPLVFVAYVDANWETTTVETVWVSDSEAIVPHYDYDYLSPSADYEGNWTWSTRTFFTTGSVFYLNDTTPLYNGNNTWVASLTDTGTLDITDDADWFRMIYEVPNTDTFLINEVDFHVSTGLGSPPDVMYLTITVWSMDGEMDDGSTNPDNDELASYTINTYTAPTSYWINGTNTVSLAQALDIYQKSALPNTKTFVVWTCYDDNGWGLKDISVEAMINGTYQKGLSASDMVYYGLGFSAGLNILVGLFMTDSIDMDTISKAVRRRR